jgi:hypothetical protein
MSESKLLPQTQIAGGFATVNGKSYRLLRAYAMREAGPGNGYDEDTIFLALAGCARLLPSDLGEHWRVARSGNVYMAYYARAFSYHLLGASDAQPVSEDWPRIKGSRWLVFVGPTGEAAVETARLALRQYRPEMSPDAIESFIQSRGQFLDDQAGSPVKALRLPV